MKTRTAGAMQALLVSIYLVPKERGVNRTLLPLMEEGSSSLLKNLKFSKNS
jgi:hypothetical protein